MEWLSLGEQGDTDFDRGLEVFPCEHYVKLVGLRKRLLHLGCSSLFASYL